MNVEQRERDPATGKQKGDIYIYIYLEVRPLWGGTFFSYMSRNTTFSSISAIFFCPKLGLVRCTVLSLFLGYPSETRILEHFLGRNQGGENFGFRVDSFTIFGCKKWIGRRFAVSVCSFSYLFTLRMIIIPCSETAYRVRNNGSVQNVYRVLPLDWNLFTNEGSN